jgi:hypothetical protein
MSQFGNHEYESPQSGWVEEQYEREGSQGIYRSPYNSQFDH